MTIRSRLTALKSQAGALPAQPATTEIPTLRNRLAHVRAERVQGLPTRSSQRMSEAELASSIGGKLIGDGLIRIERTIHLSEPVGNTAFDGLRKPALLPGETDPLPAVYLDTETTGLSGGSGTLAFLVGFAYVSGEEIKLTQLIITRFAAESELLSLLQQLLPHGHRLVSYNGKSFDVPLLVSRFRMQGLRSEFADVEHLDLLHPVRRLFSKCWDDCRLTTAEKKLLGFQRTDDLPGAEAPEAWFSFLRAGDGRKLIKVIEHNRQDILSLTAIHNTIANAVTNPLQHGVDIHGLSRWVLESDEERALHLLRSHKENMCDDGKRLLAHLSRRSERWEEALPLWEDLANKGCVESIERLAKYHEHISKNLETALHYCDRLPGSTTDRHRRNRILGKLSGASLARF